jgi:hypothetical protein
MVPVSSLQTNASQSAFESRNHVLSFQASQSRKAMNPPPVQRIYRPTPAIMIFCYVLGVAFAVAYHIFYAMMNGRAVQSNLEQQIVTSAGTAFAFVIKVLLAVTTATAYNQYLWYTMRAESVEIRLMDSMFGILGNPWGFLNVRFWIGHRVLALIAVVTW